MRKTTKHSEDLKNIRLMMQQSSHFLSLSGLNGIMAGTYALIGAFVAHILLKERVLYIRSYSTANMILILKLLGIAFTIVSLTLITAFILTKRKAKRQHLSLWDRSIRRQLIDLAIPLVSGGVFGLILLHHEHFGIISPITLIFYGLALLNASKYTSPPVRFLGVAEIITGLLATFYVGYGLYFWAFGFGILHLIYGFFMYIKERRILSGI